MAKVTVSFEWLSGCSGCELSVVDLHERLLKVLEEIDIVRLPILMDVKDYPKAALGIVTGALRTDHDVECAKKMRASCDAILAFGTCGVYGGPQGSGYAHTQGRAGGERVHQEPHHLHAFRARPGVSRPCWKKACCRSMRPSRWTCTCPAVRPTPSTCSRRCPRFCTRANPSSAATMCASTAIAT
jgi:hypothetical protein